MAQKRMFSLLVTDTDAFLDMPLSTQALYFHLGMHGDDEGFVGSPRKIARSIGCNTDDLKVLATKGFIIAFESGVVVIRDWNVNNTLRNDRFHPTIYTNEKAMLTLSNGNRYELVSDTHPLGIPTDNQLVTIGIPVGIQVGTQMETEPNLTKPNITKHRVNSVLPAEKEAEFERFWSSYPKKIGKGEARKAFAKVRGVSVDVMISAVEQQKLSRQWTSENGKYIPNPSTWLNQGRWEDEPISMPEEVKPIDFGDIDLLIAQGSGGVR